MKVIFTFFIVLSSVLAQSQSTALINYQAVARDAAGNPIPNQAIAVRFEVLRGSITGSAIATDDQLSGIKTNEFGLFTTQIGKNVNLSLIDWQNGPFFLRISMDPTGGSNLIEIGTQQIVSVPMAMHVPSNLTGNVLTIGAKSHTLDAGATITPGTGTNIVITGGPNYTISSVLPTLILSPNNASIGIVGSNTIGLPASITPTLLSSGLANVTNGTSIYTVDVPIPTYNSTTALLSFGANSTLVSPTLALLNNSVLYSGLPSNSIALPAGVTLASNSPSLSVVGGPNYSISVTQPSLALSSNNLSLSIIGSNSVALPAAVTVSAPASNNLATVSGGPTNYAVSVPLPTYNGTVLTIGASNTTIAPTVNLNGSTLTVGPTSNSVNLSNTGPFRQAVGAVTLATTSDNVGLNSPGLPSSKLEVWGNATSLLPTVKVINQNASNTTAALDVASNGALGLQVSNTNATGIAAAFSSTVGSAISAINSSSINAAILANNTDPSAASVGAYIGGGLVTQGKSLSTAFAFSARNFASSNLFVVRNDGRVGIGTSSPAGMLHIDVQLQNSPGITLDNSRDIIGGALPINLIMSTAGQTYGLNTQGRFLRAANSTSVNASYDFGIDAAQSLFITHINDYAPATFVMTTGGKIGLGVSTPTAKLEVGGNIKIVDGTQANGKILTSDASGSASWKSSPAAISFGGLNNSSVLIGTSATTLGTGNMSFTKQYASTEIEVNLYANAYTGSFASGATTICFEIYIDGAPGSASAKHCFFSTNQFGYVSLRSYFSGLSAGTHTVTIIAATDAGTSSGALLDSGGYGGKVLVKENF